MVLISKYVFFLTLFHKKSSILLHFKLILQEFMLCRDELKDPRKCLKEGREVTACSLEFFRQMKKNCAGEFNTYSTCMWKTSGDYAFNQ